MSFKIEEWQVMQAWKNGASIESTSRVHPKWVLTTEPTWNWEDNDYRIANLTADGMRLDQFCLIEEGLLYVNSLVYGIKNLICVCCENPARIGECYAITTKKEKKLRPFTYEELKQHFGKVIVSRDGNSMVTINRLYSDGSKSVSVSHGWTNIGIVNDFTFIDGSPCGVLE